MMAASAGVTTSALNARRQEHRLSLYGCISGLVSALNVAFCFASVATIAKSLSLPLDIDFASSVVRLKRNQRN